MVAMVLKEPSIYILLFDYCSYLPNWAEVPKRLCLKLAIDLGECLLLLNGLSQPQQSSSLEL